MFMILRVSIALGVLMTFLFIHFNYYHIKKFLDYLFKINLFQIMLFQIHHMNFLKFIQFFLTSSFISYHQVFQF